MIEKLTDSYFQKSFFFLYPLLSIPRKGGFSPVNTFVRIEGRKGLERGLYVVHHARGDPEFIRFRKQLTRNPFFKEVFSLGSKEVFVYDLSKMQKDYDCFIDGAYSIMSNESKKKTMVYHRQSKGTNAAYMQTFLYPGDWFPIYAELVNEPLRDLEVIGELCNKPNFQAETLIIEKGQLKSYICSSFSSNTETQNAEFTFSLQDI